MICENCGKEHNGSYGTGRFCTEKCARSYASKNTTGLFKEAKCIDCGKIIYIGKRASEKTCRCKECHINHHKPSDIRYCKICGRIYYKNEGGCKNNFCKKHNINQFNTLIKYFGFNKNKLGTIEVEDEFYRIRDIIYNLYWNEGYSSEDLGKFFKYKNYNHIILDIFVYLNIPKRTLSEANINAYINPNKFINVYQNNQYRYKSCWHTTWNNKEVYLRSSYELDFANELDKLKIDYEVESLRIKYYDSNVNDYRCAIPDFYLPDSNTIVEIKSSWTLDELNMKDKMKAYKDLGYNTKLICDHKEI